MEHADLTKRLNEVGLDQKTLPRSTLRNWAREGLIPRPTPYSKLGKQGRYRNWPEEAVEEAAAVWALRHLDEYRSSPNKEVVKLVKFEAQRVHDEYRTDTSLPFLDAWGSFDPKEVERRYLPYVHPSVILWIVTIEKVRHKKSVIDPAIVTFNWIVRSIGKDDNESSELRYEGVTFERSERNNITFYLGTRASDEKKTNNVNSI